MTTNDKIVASSAAPASGKQRLGMPTCAVRTCTNNTSNSRRRDGVSYFIFPKDPFRRSEWTRIIRKSRGEETYEPCTFSHVCSDHFPASAIYTTDKGFKRLSRNSKPTLNLNTEAADAPSSIMEDTSSSQHDFVIGTFPSPEIVYKEPPKEPNSSKLDDLNTQQGKESVASPPENKKAACAKTIPEPQSPTEDDQREEEDDQSEAEEQECNASELEQLLKLGDLTSRNQVLEKKVHSLYKDNLALQKMNEELVKRNRQLRARLEELGEPLEPEVSLELSKFHAVTVQIGNDLVPKKRKYTKRGEKWKTQKPSKKAKPTPAGMKKPDSSPKDASSSLPREEAKKSSPSTSSSEKLEPSKDQGLKQEPGSENLPLRPNPESEVEVTMIPAKTEVKIENIKEEKEDYEEYTVVIEQI